MWSRLKPALMLELAAFFYTVKQIVAWTVCLVVFGFLVWTFITNSDAA
jgi:hypothetical protein